MSVALVLTASVMFIVVVMWVRGEGVDWIQRILTFRPKCEHLNQRCIHGDEIIFSGYKRAQCLNCKKFLPTLPTVCSVTGYRHDWYLGRDDA